MTESPLIIALDFESADQARALISELGSAQAFYKVGMELYAAAGMDLVQELKALGKRVFLDMKYYDIGETVRRAVAQVAKSGADFLTVHASGAVMRAAIEGRGDSKLKILAVTVLTSFNDDDVHELGYTCSAPELVKHLASVAVKCRVDGLITSPLEVRTVRTITGPDRILVTPGVRSAGAARGDQKRVATPAEALANGANYLVIGRQVTRAADPAAALSDILQEIGTAPLTSTR
jgi:orotidine-5'-phosphate decarboxylase